METLETEDTMRVQKERLFVAGVNLPTKEMDAYLDSPDSLGVMDIAVEDIPYGYKRCGGCKEIKKFYLFNVNNSTKNKCTGNCKACQKKAAAASYERNKSKRDYKKYYAENKERKQEHGRKYYAENKEKVLEKQKEYHTSKKGKKVMRKAHAKRRKLLAENRGIPYKREWVIDRDKLGLELPVCYLCGTPITTEKEIHMDHVVPVVMGGKDCFTNVACTHDACNLTKEKDARNLTTEQVELIIERAESYIDEHPDLFDLD